MNKLFQNNRMGFKFFLILLLVFYPCYISAKVFSIGPGKEYSEVEHFPFDELKSGDTVKIFFREKAYNGIFIIRGSGSRKKPIVITGVPSKNGKLPIIDGSNAIQSQHDISRQDGRWLIKIGDKKPGDYVIVKKLHLKNANNTKTYIESQ